MLLLIRGKRRMKYKYHRGKASEDKGRCMGKHCLICWSNGRTKSLYGDKIVPLSEKGGKKNV